MRNILTYFFCVMVLVLLPSWAIGQKTVTGKVTDGDSGEPLVGATVIVVGTSSGAFTDESGSFSVEAPADAESLLIRYTGYAEQTVAIDGSNINVSLKPGIELDEVVVIGYGRVKKDDATGSVESVKSDVFNRGAITSPQDLLAGKVAGVQITPSTQPGGGAQIRIRGGSSLSASNNPLIVIDGVPIANDDISGARNPLNLVNPNDIESFTVLKDASATAIYGSRASNGVIIITTKKGEAGKKLNVNFNTSLTFSQPMKRTDVLTADEFRTMINSQYDDTHPARGLLGDANTDWQDQIFQTGVMSDNNLSLSSGIGRVPFRVSVGYTSKEGVLKTDKFRRTTAGVNLTPGFFDNTLQLTLSVKSMFTKNNFADNGAIGNAVSFDPTQPVLDAGNAYGGYFTWQQPNGDPNPLAATNPLALLEQKSDVSDVKRIIASAQVDYRMWFLKDLRANLNMAYDYSYGEGMVNIPENAAFEFTNGGRRGEYNQTKKNELIEFYLDYAKDFKEKHDFNIMGGYSWQHFYKDNYAFATGVDTTVVLDPANSDPKEYYLLSLFGRLNYAFDNKLLVTATVRRDGTSRFSKENRWGLFPSAAIAYKIFSDRDGKVSNLKIRASYGITGQQDIGEDYYPYLSRYLAGQDNVMYQFGDQFYTTLRPNGYDANIKWEETTTYNVGLDFGFFKERLYGSIEYYRRKTTDLINFIPVPAGTNLTNFITTNVGDLENNGIEVSLNGVLVQKRDFNWEVGVNVTANSNKITRLTATEDTSYLGVFTGGISGGVGNNIQIHSVGQTANSFFVYEQVYDEQGVPIEGLYVDRNGDGQITPDDRYHSNDPFPTAFLGFTSNLRWRNLVFSFAGRANIGSFVYNNILSEHAFYSRSYSSTDYLSNVHAQTSAIDFNNPEYFSDHFIQNASFVRLDHITLSYTFDQLFGRDYRIQLYGTVQNPFVITNYDGIDPELNDGTDIGIDKNIYPRSRGYLIGLNANF